MDEMTTNETKTRHEPLPPDAMGVPYFMAEIKNGREYGVCPRCSEWVLRKSGAFGKHWEDAVRYETTAG